MRLCVFGAASSLISREYIEPTEELGRQIAKRGHSMVYGAGASGMMGAAARGCYEMGGKIIGVAPRFFSADGLLFDHCTELIRTDTMRQRKQIMEDNSDAFIIVPGGIGTYDEFFEILTLKQLGRHKKPIVIYNLNGFYEPMLSFIQNAMDHKFLLEACKNLYSVCADIDSIFDYLDNYVPVEYDLLDMKVVDTEK